MEFDDFFIRFKEVFKPGTSLDNPGGNTSECISYTGNNVCYRRKDSDIRVSVLELYTAYKKFIGKTCSTNDLKDYKPSIFNSKCSGHSCNCTLLFMVLTEMKRTEGIKGGGVKGDPFYVFIKDES